jgi:hypothetical protein
MSPLQTGRVGPYGYMPLLPGRAEALLQAPGKGQSETGQILSNHCIDGYCPGYYPVEAYLK